MKHSFSVVTPTYNAHRWIRTCVASVADQEGAAVEHFVQDGLSSDGTSEYVLAESRIRAESVKDAGMYDAINRAWAKCEGDYALHLNADEQLLPGALERVGTMFQSHPELDVVIGGTLVCNSDGSLRFYRKALKPKLPILLTSHHPIPSAAVFFRRSSFRNRKWLYDPSFRLISDVLLMIDIVKSPMKIGLLSGFTSVFLMTGENLGLSRSPRAILEYDHQMSLAKPWMRRMRPAIKFNYQMIKLLKGHYSRRPIEYDLYVPGNADFRQHFAVARPSGIFREE